MLESDVGMVRGHSTADTAFCTLAPAVSTAPEFSKAAASAAEQGCRKGAAI
jgi:hypothetical protein